MLAIPESVYSKLNADLRPCVDKSFATFSRILLASKMPFFPDYTDHGEPHIQQVLNSSVELIQNDAMDMLTPQDVAALSLAVLLHDLAMHFTLDGFFALVNGKTNLKPIAGLDEHDWPDLWRDFRAEASRFSGQQNNSLTGDPDPVSLVIDSNGWDVRQRYLAGEFLRRHHPALAHQIALYGFPGHDPKTPVLFERGNQSEQFFDLVGLVARSHGMPLRACVDFLKRAGFSSKAMPLNVHAPFIMVLLRIGDYIQLHSERAPVEYLRLEKLRSPISVKEWKQHQPIERLHIEWPEVADAMFVEVRPIESLSVFLGIKKLLGGLQEELDRSWSILAELYGSKTSAVNRLGIKPRQVLSNINDEEYQSGLAYLPVESRFDVADSQIIRKLIEPLYGEEPQVGIRELLQNSIDAIRERRSVTNKTLRAARKWRVKIQIKKDRSGCWFSIEDDGIGMTADTVRDYFLKAGASFRDSSAWKRKYQTDSRESKVVRSGRFGIGTLAAFLIGEEIHVLTRHVDSPDSEGISFSAKVEDELIELRPEPRSSPGTTIKISITAQAFELLKDSDAWEWYLRDWPEVEQRVQKAKLGPRILNLVPNEDDEDTPNWNRIDQDKFEALHWTYSKAPRLTCNGIVVGRNPSSPTTLDIVWPSPEGVPYRVPNLSVFDRNGRLQLDLQRYGLVQNACPSDRQVASEVLADHVAFLLANSPEQFPDVENKADGYQRYPGLEEERRSAGLADFRFPYAFSKNGSVFAHPAFLRSAEIGQLLLIFEIGTEGRHRVPDAIQSLTTNQAVIFGAVDRMADVTKYMSGHFGVHNNPLPLSGARVFYDREEIAFKSVIENAEALKLTQIDAGPIVAGYEHGSCQRDAPKDWLQFYSDAGSMKGNVIVELFHEPTEAPESRNFFFNVFEETIQRSPLIPYQRSERVDHDLQVHPDVSRNKRKWKTR